MVSYSNSSTISNLVKEPAAFYAIDNKYDRIVSVLGGSLAVGQAVNNAIDLIELTRKGLSKTVLESVSFVLGISMEEMSSLLHISHRTLQRKSENDLLSVYTTEQILEIADVISKGIQVFDSIENFKKWLHQDLRALNDNKPINFLDTSFGTQLVKDILGRLEHGVY